MATNPQADGSNRCPDCGCARLRANTYYEDVLWCSHCGLMEDFGEYTMAPAGIHRADISKYEPNAWLKRKAP